MSSLLLYVLIATIYIPIWLDLLSPSDETLGRPKYYLHSNMVRFIIKVPEPNFESTEAIYIPIWLDLLFNIISISPKLLHNLHSNMVRFIIPQSYLLFNVSSLFTFQYG